MSVHIILNVLISNEINKQVSKIQYNMNTSTRFYFIYCITREIRVKLTIMCIQ